MRHRILLRLFHLAKLLLSFSLGTLRICLVRLGCCGFRVGVPVQVAALLPSPDGGLETVAEVVFTMGRVSDLVPAEVDTTAGAGLSYCREQIHVDKKVPLARRVWCIWSGELVGLPNVESSQF
jgi:hypothetical protein